MSAHYPDLHEQSYDVPHGRPLLWRRIHAQKRHAEHLDHLLHLHVRLIPQTSVQDGGRRRISSPEFSPHPVHDMRSLDSRIARLQAG
ncbi:hypothetical protein GW17_00008598 [Ensete ventricosum]|nr:hypothetical protein GW17_00008598 [Ensete ventricosum]